VAAAFHSCPVLAEGAQQPDVDSARSRGGCSTAALGRTRAAFGGLLSSRTRRRLIDGDADPALRAASVPGERLGAAISNGTLGSGPWSCRGASPGSPRQRRQTRPTTTGSAMLGAPASGIGPRRQPAEDRTGGIRGCSRRVTCVGACRRPVASPIVGKIRAHRSLVIEGVHGDLVGREPRP